MKVFVYGSLRRDFHNHRVLLRGGATYLGTGRTRSEEWDMISIRDHYPAVIKGTHRIWGEVYEVDALLLAQIDHIEGHPDVYCRRGVLIRPHGWVWMYVGQTELIEWGGITESQFIRTDDEVQAWCSSY